ncbi:MAG TPA: hypothetical protein VFM37_04520 [Pseudonocardiaceae bacterium]|nr:hypothetical protein [Pseudonocardiaceae bacterium]
MDLRGCRRPVGRTDDLAVLNRLLGSATAGRPNAALLTAEAGIGKDKTSRPNW